MEFEPHLNKSKTLTAKLYCTQQPCGVSFSEVGIVKEQKLLFSDTNRAHTVTEKMSVLNLLVNKNQHSLQARLMKSHSF